LHYYAYKLLRAQVLELSVRKEKAPTFVDAFTMVALTGSSSNFRTHVSRLVAGLPALLGRRPPVHPIKQRQVQRRLTPKQAARLAAEYQAGDSMQQLADRWNLHRTTVADHLHRAGVTIRQRGISPERLDEAIQLYGEGWSCQRLAERFDCDDETVRQTLKRAGVKLRKPWERA
jgi:DNA-binding CsgD family transcriptional regulator